MIAPAPDDRREGSDTRRLSIIVPVLNEAATIDACLGPLQTSRESGLEVVVVDGGSDDDTVSKADRLADRVLSSPAPGRARQMNLGWRAAAGQRFVFLHADTRLDGRHLDVLARTPGPCWGRFDVRLSSARPIFRVIEFFMNARSRLTGMATGDQAVFVDRPLLEAIGGFPELPLMEDLALSQALRGRAPYRCLRPAVVSSSRRWERHGVLRTILLMWRLRFAWWRGADPAELAERYRHAR